MPGTNDWSANKMIGKTVRNSAGESLGKIEDLVIDPTTGGVAFGILSFGGLLGMGDKLVAVPWRALNGGSNGDDVMLDVDKNVLERAPSFDRTRLPDLNDPS